MALLSRSFIPEKSAGVGRALIATAALVALLYYGRDFFVTLIVSAIFAFILDPAVLFVMQLRVPRAAATTLVIGVALVAVYFIGAMAWSQISTLTEDLPSYGSRVGEVVSAVNTRVDEIERKTLDVVLPKNLRQQEQQIQQKPAEAQRARRRRAGAGAAATSAGQAPAIQEVRIHAEPPPVISTVYDYVSGYMHVLLMASFVPFLVYFMLSWQDHINRRFLQLFPGENRYVVGKSWSQIGNTTRAFVLGNFLLWVFLAAISGVSFFFLGLPYWPLIGLLSALFSLVPYVGLPLSLLPPVLAAIAVPNKFRIVIGAILITTALHLVTMNFLYPKIVGRRVRLNPLVVTVAMMFWGLLWGGVGLVLAIPITAAVKAVCDEVESLEPLGRLLSDD